MKAMVLAAGVGSRLGELTENTPKPMVSIAGRPVLEHNLRWLAASGVDEVVINLHHLGDVIADAIGDGAHLGLRVHYSLETELRGTAGALAPVRGRFAEAPFLVVYGDNLFDFDLAKLIADHAQTAAVATLALFSVDRHEHTGIAGGRVEMDRSGRILRFVEGADEPGLDLVNAACYVVEPSLLDHIPDDRPFDFGRDLFPLVLRGGGILGGHVIDGRCLGLDTPEALAMARKIFGQPCRG